MSSRGAMTKAEMSELVYHEGVIRRHMPAAIEVAQSLHAINKKKLFRGTHNTFETYLEDMFPEMSRQRANQLENYAEICENVNQGLQIEIPTERHARPLTGLPPEAQRSVWDAATDGGRTMPTAARVAELAAKARPTRAAVPLEEMPAPQQRAAVREAESRVCKELDRREQADGLDAMRRALARVYEKAVRYRPALAAGDRAQAQADQRSLVSLLRRAQAMAARLT